MLKCESLVNSSTIMTWKSKGLSEENIKSSLSDNSLGPELNYNMMLKYD